MQIFHILIISSLPDEHLGYFQFGAIINNAAMNSSHMQIVVVDICSQFSGEELPGHMVSLANTLRKCQIGIF